ncbi:cation channel sperm-associated protein subunit gamma 1-like isoform X2 [Misgurnus anguillicaudatus]|uniref:cation channel sperm-associated protein subunit gamma 1-like isoform X2 n=1 Tax=Misgurnus anguillicaudatus TaxID=75329 RepID=UPI003CCF8370
MKVVVFALLVLSEVSRAGQISTKAPPPESLGSSFKDSTLTGYSDCSPDKQLVFDVHTTLQASLHLNKRNISCRHPDLDIPCFLYGNHFFPSFLIHDLVLGETSKFLGSYTLKVVGGGAQSREHIRQYGPEEVLRYNSHNYSSKATLVWGQVKLQSFNRTTEGFFILNGSRNNGFRWLCMKKSPCGDFIAQGLTTPRFYFIIEVSNRNIDVNKSCNYTSHFEIMVLALPVSADRKLFILLMSLTPIFGLMFFYCMIQLMKAAISECHGNTQGNSQ